MDISNQSQRIFDVEIVTPADQVFDGEVSFNVSFSVEVNAHANATVTADCKIARNFDPAAKVSQCADYVEKYWN